jgi:hypothetical protein
MTDPRSAGQASADRSIILIDAPTADVSSSAIRRRLATGESIAGLVPASSNTLNNTDFDFDAARTRRVDAPKTPAAGRLHGETEKRRKVSRLPAQVDRAVTPPRTRGE